MLLKGETLAVQQHMPADVIPASIEKGAAVCPDLRVCEGIVLRYAEILLRDAGECPEAFSESPPPDVGITVVELR